jgi:hypothetical protein
MEKVKHEKPQMRTRSITKILVFFSFIFVFFSVCEAANAASLYFSPSSGSYNIGQTFSVSVYVSSADQAMNAASGVISFPSDKLEVTSLSKTGSIFTLWVQEPSFSNSAGTVNFEGIVLNPGFTGSSGKAITITFRTKAAGNTPLTFSSGSALANDGKGTNILTGMGDANFSIGTIQPGAPEIVTPAEVAGTPEAPVINSPTHPDPNKWYAKSSAKFNWNVPKDITAVRLLVGRIPNAIPTITYTSPINSKDVSDLADGIWYFSVRLKNNAGWGAVSHFRFQIDTEKPTRFDLSEVERKDLTDPRAKFTFDASDKTSGIDHFEVQIDDNDSEIWQDDGNHIYTTPLLGPGNYTLIAKAVDKAGNSLANSADFIIRPLEAPIIIDYPKELQSGETLIIKGKTKYPGAQINFWLQHEKDDPKNYSVRSDQDGKFTFVADEKLSSGVYTAWAEVTDARGAKSNPSEKVTISVGQPVFLKIGSWAVGFLAVIIPLVALVFALLFIIWYGCHKFSSFRKKIRKETKEAEQALHQAFKALKEETEEQVAKLDGKTDLSEREKRICNNLKKALKISEKFIGKEIEDIEREIKKQ